MGCSKSSAERKLAAVNASLKRRKDLKQIKPKTSRRKEMIKIRVGMPRSN